MITSSADLPGYLGCSSIGMPRPLSVIVSRLPALERDLDPGGMAGDRLVHAVVEHLGGEVMQRALVGAADIHARPAPDRLQPLEHLDRTGRHNRGTAWRRKRTGRTWTGYRGCESGCQADWGQQPIHAAPEPRSGLNPAAAGVLRRGARSESPPVNRRESIEIGGRHLVMRLDRAGTGRALRELDFPARAIVEIGEVVVDHITHVMQLHPCAPDLGAQTSGYKGGSSTRARSATETGQNQARRVRRTARPGPGSTSARFLESGRPFGPLGASLACRRNEISGPAGRRTAAAAAACDRAAAAGPDRRRRNARRNRESRDWTACRRNGNRARRDGRSAICRSSR